MLETVFIIISTKINYLSATDNRLYKGICTTTSKYRNKFHVLHNLSVIYA